MRQALIPLSIVILLTGCGSSSGTGNASGGVGGAGGAPPKPTTSLVKGLSIARLTFNQGVQVPLAENGQPAPNRPVAVVRGRSGLFRVFLNPEPEWQPREVVARLETSTGEARQISGVVQNPSAQGDINSSFNFELPGAEITSDMKYSVTLYEASPNATGAGSDAQARFPAQGQAELGALNNGPSMKVVMVPVRYGADGSGRLPDTSPERIEMYRRDMLAVYPVADIEMSVREQPLDYSGVVGGMGQGWAQLLQAVLQERQRDGVPSDVYYYGLFQPTDSLQQFCPGGCVAGLSALAFQASDATQRVSIGISFEAGFMGADIATNSFVHEVGHAAGREHAPCMLLGQPSDPNYPHPGATLGSWGWNRNTGELIDPGGSHRDFMSYCSPTWISDYTYNGLFERVRAVNGAQREIPGPSTQYTLLRLDKDGAVEDVGEQAEFRRQPGGYASTLDIKTAGRIQRVSGYYYPFSHLGGGFMWVRSNRLPIGVIAANLRMAELPPGLHSAVPSPAH